MSLLAGWLKGFFNSPNVPGFLQYDPTVRLLLWVRRPHPDVLDALLALTEGYSGRAIGVLHKNTTLADRPIELQAHALEDAIWDACRFHFTTNRAVVMKGPGALWKRHGHKDHSTVERMPGCVSLDKLNDVLLRAERLLFDGANQKQASVL